MSMNVACYLKKGSLEIEVDGLVQTPTSESYYIVYRPFHLYKDKRPWRESAKMYLEFVQRRFCPESPELVKHQRRLIGRAWKEAEGSGGSLVFTSFELSGNMSQDFWMGIFRTFSLEQIASLLCALHQVQEEKYGEMIEFGEYVIPTEEIREVYAYSAPKAAMMYKRRHNCDIIFAKMVLDHCYLRNKS